ncbi:hypothetical protein EW146_g2159 [Bondarzewia mesenterica]|uniref:Uncharacterized protein n=1 Tax=Bondarzewia mesenterica TaxID=1095465 RepID=A0A4S4M216_9AGAM|nr:hypothetical protein EW146_g2159 [Bondarzewia mesenterica]
MLSTFEQLCQPLVSSHRQRLYHKSISIPFPLPHLLQEPSTRTTAGRDLTTLLKATLNPILRLATKSATATVAASNGR